MNLRALMLVIGVLAIWMGWFIQKVKIQREAVAAIYRAGGSVRYDAEYDVGNGLQRRLLAPRWLTDSLGMDLCSTVYMVSYHKTGADELAGYLAKLSKLDTVDFSESDLSDSGLSHLRGLNLQRLMLCDTKVTDVGIHHLRGMTNLDVLYIDRTSVGDDAMAALASLPRLAHLLASETHVGDAGANSIAKFPSLMDVDLMGTQVGDAGVALLKSLLGLRRLPRGRVR